MGISYIERRGENEFFVQTTTFMSDLTYKADVVEFVNDTTLKGVKGFRVGFPITVNLKAERAAQLKALAVGDRITF